MAQLLGISNLVTLDMGGTSTDVSTIVDGREKFTTDFEIEWGRPIQIPMLDIRSIGAGGGSIARIDAGRHAGRRPAKRRRQPRTGLLSARRQAADGDRRQCGDRQDQSGQFSRRQNEPRRRCRARRHPADCRSSRPAAGKGGAVDHPHRQQQHGGRAAQRADRARPRPARFRAGGVRRRRPACMSAT